MSGVALDFSKAQPLSPSSGATLDFSRAQPISDSEDHRNIFQKAQAGIDQTLNAPPTDSGWKGEMENFGQTAAKTLLAPVVHPVQTLKGLGDATSGPFPGFQPAVDEATGLHDAYQQGGTPRVLSTAAGQVAGGALLSGVIGAGSAALDEIKPPPPIGGQNFTPAQYRAHAAVVAEGSAAGNPNYIPQNLAMKTGSILRQTAADNPQLASAVKDGTPLEAYQAHQQILQQAKSTIDQAHQAALQPVQNTPVDTTAIQHAIEPNQFKIQGMDPQDLAAIKDLQARAANVKDLGGLNQFRMLMNSEDATLGKNMTPAKTAGYPDLVHDMANATRQSYYDALQQATGKDFSGLKNTEGSLIEQIRGANSAAPRLAANEAKADATLPRSTIADIVEGGTRSGSPGIPLVSGAATKIGDMIRGTKLGQVQQQLQRMYSNLPDPTPAQAATPVTPPSRMLPAQSGAPTILPYHPQMSPGEQTAALMQYLRQNPQLQLPAKASAIPLPPGTQ